MYMVQLQGSSSSSITQFFYEQEENARSAYLTLTDAMGQNTLNDKTEMVKIATVQDDRGFHSVVVAAFAIITIADIGTFISVGQQAADIMKSKDQVGFAK